MKSSSSTNEKQAYLYLKDILESCEIILSATANLSREEYDGDITKREFLYWRIFLIGEGIRNLPIQVRDLAPEVPWKTIAGLRNLMAHRYYEIRPSAVWIMATESVPILEPSIRRLVAHFREKFGEDLSPR